MKASTKKLFPGGGINLFGGIDQSVSANWP